MSANKQAVRRTGSARLPVHDIPVRNVASLGDVLDEFRDRPELLGMDSVDPAAVEIGLKIRRVREASKVSQQALAEKSGLNQATISLIETGKGPDGPSYRTLRTITRALGVGLELIPASSPAAAVLATIPLVGTAVRTLEAIRLIAPDALRFVEETRGVGSVGPLLKALYGPETLAETHRAVQNALAGASSRAPSGEEPFCGYWSAAPHSAGSFAAKRGLLVMALGGEGSIRRKTKPGIVSSDRVEVVAGRSQVEVVNAGSERLGFVTMPIAPEVAASLEAVLDP